MPPIIFAKEGFFKGCLRILVNSLVVGEVRVLSEGLLTLGAFVRFLAGMDSLMLD